MNSEFIIAVHALVFLYHKQEVVASDVLAENVCTNPVCIRKVMGKLKKAGLVDTKEGASGGYRLCRDGADCTLQSVGEALGTEFVKATWTSGNADKECMICSGMAKIIDEMASDMNKLCREYMEKLTVADIERKVLASKSENTQDSSIMKIL
ncbi:Rrf2 family transcriptional regulator [bacterium]|uniref:RrF2 family transcriptional regulator n=1 Tax=Lachnospiraceae TaxID=186803 RepID=UPI002A28F0DF|nr:Rrf2 family transcriptional regulator [bacterium]MDY2886519.1 Rrf2 family transcriptional regulator [Bariatricus sp.]MCI7149327.1 Rrf2 family transcriptional regulator [bacterium]MDD6515068.1 Rrf2 family transcriptional regulator [bacterium]MDY4193328.1 Rrf2 family transcriptional regulator [Bariatricus sp.]